MLKLGAAYQENVSAFVRSLLVSCPDVAAGSLRPSRRERVNLADSLQCDSFFADKVK